MPQTARSSVVLPAPFAPRTVVMPPSSHLESDVVQDIGGAIPGGQSVRLQQRRHQAAPR